MVFQWDTLSDSRIQLETRSSFQQSYISWIIWKYWWHFKALRYFQVFHSWKWIISACFYINKPFGADKLHHNLKENFKSSDLRKKFTDSTSLHWQGTAAPYWQTRERVIPDLTSRWQSAGSEECVFVGWGGRLLAGDVTGFPQVDYLAFLLEETHIQTFTQLFACL